MTAGERVDSDLEVVDRLLALSTVAGESAACALHGDLATARILGEYYSLAADAASVAGGRLVKVMGGGVLFLFPTSRATDAVAALEQLQREGTILWGELDQRCRVQIRITAGAVAVGLLGPPNDLRFDVYGTPLNALFKLEAGDFVVASPARSLLNETP